MAKGQGSHFTVLYVRLVKKKRKLECNGPRARGILRAECELIALRAFPGETLLSSLFTSSSRVRRWDFFSLLFAQHVSRISDLVCPSARWISVRRLYAILPIRSLVPPTLSSDNGDTIRKWEMASQVDR